MEFPRRIIAVWHVLGPDVALAVLGWGSVVSVVLVVLAEWVVLAKTGLDLSAWAAEAQMGLAKLAAELSVPGLEALARRAEA